MTTSDTGPIFVVGYMHSGTTLVRRILANSPEIYASFGETRFFTNLSLFRTKFPNLSDDRTLHDYLRYVIAVVQNGFAQVFRNEKEHDDNGSTIHVSDEGFSSLFMRSQKVRDHVALYPMVFEFLMHEAGKRRWLEKTPTHLFHIDEILDAIPDARFIELIRDPRDILASKMARRQRGGSADAIWDSLAWRSALTATQRFVAQPATRVHRVRYQHLTTNPAKAVREICEFLTLTYDPALLHVDRINATSVAPANTRGITSAAVGRWKDELRPREVAAVQFIAGPRMKQLGLNLAPLPLKTRLSAGLLAFRSCYEFFERLYRRWRDGGTAYVNNVFRNYGKRLSSLVGNR